MSYQTSLDDVKKLLARAERLLFITGAGLSAGSGLPTYRGQSGLYNMVDTEDGIPIEAALSGEMMKKRPELTWRYIAQIEAAARGAKPNPGHEAIAALQDDKEVWIFTQNVDGLHQQAGSYNVIDIHGDIRRLRCTACTFCQTVNDYGQSVIPAECPECHSYLRPDVVLFDELLPSDKLRQLTMQSLLGWDIVLSVGTTSLFPYIAEPVVRAFRQGIPTIEINPEPTQVSDFATHRLAERAEIALPAILAKN